MFVILTIHHALTKDAGAPGVTLRLAEEYARQGHEVALYSYDDLPTGLSEQAKQVLFPFYLARHLGALARRRRIDVVDASTADAWVWSLVRPAGGPVLVTRSHGLEHTVDRALREEARRGALRLSWKYGLYRGSWHLKAVETSLRRADGVLLLNRLDREHVEATLRVAGPEIRVVANGLLDSFLGLPLAPTPLAADARIGIAQVGSYIADKGVRYSAAALTRVLARHPEAHAAFFGTGCGPERVLADFPAALHPRIRVVSRFDNEALPGLLADYHIKLLPSLREGFSLALIEAMACGLAPVTSRNGGSLEVIEDGRNGHLAPIGDVEAVERALERLLIDRVALDRMRRAAHADAQRYSWPTIAGETLAFYQTLARHRAAPQPARPAAGALG